jgi:hypothetical protein
MWRQVMTYHRKSLDELIKNVESDMLDCPPESEEYKALLESLERLRKLKDNNRPKRLDRNTILLVAGNLLGILVIVVYEQKHVMTSKGLREIIKPKY